MGVFERGEGAGDSFHSFTLLDSVVRSTTASSQEVRNILLYPPGFVEVAASPLPPGVGARRHADSRAEAVSPQS
jgi:hypothetical protein